jgi:hypothetical protein
MTSVSTIDWRSILLGFAAACLAITVLSLVAPLRDRYLLAGLAGATCLVSAALAFRSPVQGSERH